MHARSTGIVKRTGAAGPRDAQGAARLCSAAEIPPSTCFRCTDAITDANLSDRWPVVNTPRSVVLSFANGAIDRNEIYFRSGLVFHRDSVLLYLLDEYLVSVTSNYFDITVKRSSLRCMEPFSTRISA